MGETRGVYRVLVGKPERKRPLGRPRHRWIFRKWDVGSINWIKLAQDRDRWRAVVTAIMKLRVT
jgi:hypothetical protein